MPGVCACGMGKPFWATGAGPLDGRGGELQPGERLQLAQLAAAIDGELAPAAKVAPHNGVSLGARTAASAAGMWKDYRKSNLGARRIVSSPAATQPALRPDDFLNFMALEVNRASLVALVTYEGTAGVHALVTGQALTGIQAFR